MKKIWNELTKYVTKEQSMYLFLYLGFVSFLENRKKDMSIRWEPSANIASLKRLSEIFEEISEGELKRAVNNFEESIDWDLIIHQESCFKAVRDLRECLKYRIRSYEDLNHMIARLSEVQGGDFVLTPDSVNRLIAGFPINERMHSVADLFCGLSGTGLAFLEEYNKSGRKIHLIGVEQRKLYCDISQIRMFCYGIERPEVRQADVMQEEEKKEYDLVIADLPKGNNESIYAGHNTFLGDKEKVFAEWVAIQRVMNQVSENGKAIMIVTKGALVRQREKSIREILTERDWLEAVITLPDNLYAFTPLGFEVLVLNKCKPRKFRGQVFFADLGQEEHGKNGISLEMTERIQRGYREWKEELPFSTVVSREMIGKQDFSWNPFLYLQIRKRGKEQVETVDLGEIADIHRGAQISREDELALSNEATHYWLNIRNIENEDIIFDNNSMIRAKMPDWEEKFSILEEDIILTSKGAVLKVCMVRKGMPEAFLCGNLTRIRVKKEKYSSYLLYEFLKSREGRVALECIQSGTTIKVLNNTNLSKLPVSYFKNYKEKGNQLRRIYEEYWRAEKEIRETFEKQRNKLLGELQPFAVPKEQP